MKLRQRVSKAEGAEPSKATHRLTGISVNEVSIVDRGANQRKYLVVKDEKQAETEKDGEVTPPASPAPPTPPTPSATDVGVQISAEARQQMMELLKSASEQIGAIADVLKSAAITPGAPPPTELVSALARVGELLKSGIGAAPAPADETKSDAEKAGRKISAARIAQLQAVRDTIDQLLSDGTVPVADPPASEDAEPAEKSDAKPATNPEFDEMKAVLAGLVESVKTMSELFEGQTQRLDTLAKSRGESRQADLDTPRERAPEKVVWDLDMAAPLKTIQ